MSLGVAPKRLWGWEPRTYTQYVFDGDRVIGEVSTTEPEFDPGQVAILLAHGRLERDKNSVGIPLDVAMNPDNQFKFRASGPTVDWAEKALHDAQKRFYDQYDKPGAPADRAGHKWSVKLVD